MAYYFPLKTASLSSTSCCLLTALLCSLCSLTVAKTPPASKLHVKQTSKGWVKYSSKLTHIIELNYTQGFAHADGKPLVTQAVKNIAKNEGLGLTHITGTSEGTVAGGIPAYTVTDLTKGQVIVSNNVAVFNATISLPKARREALRSAVQDSGVGFMMVHSGFDDETGPWPWYKDTLFPMNWQQHGDRTYPLPVYKHLAQNKHVVLEGVLEKVINIGTVPDEKDQDGKEILAANVSYRPMIGEWNQWGHNIFDDPKLKDNITMLLKYDGRAAPKAVLESAYKRTGGNAFTWIHQVGKAKVSFFPPGHNDSELVIPNVKSFDQGTGDLEKYLTQLLYYMAGYAETPCDSSCDSLQIVSVDDQVTGALFNKGLLTSTSPRLRGLYAGINVMGAHVYLKAAGTYRLELWDTKGRLVFGKKAKGDAVYNFSDYEAGVYFVKLVQDRGRAVSAKLIVF